MSRGLSTFRDLKGSISAVLVNGSASGSTPVRDVAEKITYSVRGVEGGAHNAIVGVVPCNRRFSKARVISAKVGDMCDIRINTSSGETCLYVYTERDDLYDCDLNPIETI